MTTSRSGGDVSLRPTAFADLEFVVALERDPDNASFIGQWSRDEHAAAIARPDREHWIVALPGAANPVGYLIAYDLRGAGLGVHVKRIVVREKSRGVGRRALAAFLAHAEQDLASAFVWLTVYAENVRAQRCYAALGFRVTDLPPAERRVYHDAADGFTTTSKVMIVDTRKRR